MIKTLTISKPNEKVLLPFDREKPFCKIVSVEIVSKVIESISPGTFNLNYCIDYIDRNSFLGQIADVDFKRPGKIDTNQTTDLRGQIKSLAFEFELRSSLAELTVDFEGKVILHYELIDKLDTSIPTAGFDGHLADSRNVKILFSAPFGQGKTTFLKMQKNWKTYKLDDIAEILNSKRVPLNSRDRSKRQGKIPYYGASGVVDHIDDFIFDGEHVLISEDGENLRSRNTAIAFKADGQFWVNNHAHILKGKTDFLNDWIVYYIANLDVNPYLTGAVQPKLNKQALLSIPIVMPELEEVEAIASILSALDDKIELNLQMNKTLEEMAMTLYKHWFVDFGPFQDGKFVDSELGRIPEGWEVKKLGDVSSIIAGGDKPKNSSKEPSEHFEIPIYSNGITNEGLYGFTDKARITEESVTVSARGTIGYVCLRMHPYLPIVRLISAVPDLKYLTGKYLYLALKTFNILGTGTTQQQLTAPDFKETKIIIPKLEIVNEFTQIVDSFYKSIVANKEEIESLTKTRDTLLPKLISGEVRVKEIEKMLNVTP